MAMGYHERSKYKTQLSTNTGQKCTENSIQCSANTEPERLRCNTSKFECSLTFIYRHMKLGHTRKWQFYLMLRLQ
jgi:hypothetical protein